MKSTECLCIWLVKDDFFLRTMFFVVGLLGTMHIVHVLTSRSVDGVLKAVCQGWQDNTICHLRGRYCSV